MLRIKTFAPKIILRRLSFLKAFFANLNMQGVVKALFGILRKVISIYKGECHDLR